MNDRQRKVIEAYNEFCGVSDGRFDGLSDDEMQGAAFKGYSEFRGGWDAAIRVISEEIDRLSFAIDYGGNKYPRPAGVDSMVEFIEKIKG